MDIDIQWDRAEKYARQFAFRHFEIPDASRVENLRNNIFEYIREPITSIASKFFSK